MLENTLETDDQLVARRAPRPAEIASERLESGGVGTDRQKIGLLAHQSDACEGCQRRRREPLNGAQSVAHGRHDDAGERAEKEARPFSALPLTTGVTGETQMHFAKCGQSNADRLVFEGNDVLGRRSLATLDSVEPDRESRDCAEVVRRLGDPVFRAKHERLYREMRERLAPASEGPVVNPGRKRSGRLVFGDGGWRRRADPACHTAVLHGGSSAS
jgi:hypothetical protein